MDVNAILNNLNSSNQYDSSSQIEKKTQTNYEKPSSVSNESGKKDTQKDLDKTIDTLNKFLKEDKKHAEYSIYEKLDRVMIKIVDDKTNKVVMEIPQEKLLDSISSMLENDGLLDKKA